MDQVQAKSRRYAAALTAALGLVAPILVGVSSPVAAVGGYSISTDGRPANIRSGPSTNYAAVDALNNGTPIDIACQATGGPAYTDSGAVSYIWDQLNSPDGGNWVWDGLTTTPNFNSYSPGIPQ